jgi:hypothetical protein
MPTILWYAGMRPPDEIEGFNLADVLEGRIEPRAFNAVSRLVRTPGEHSSVSFRTEDLKYIIELRRNQVTERFYDLRKDPGERNPLFWRQTRMQGDDITEMLSRVKELLSNEESREQALRDKLAVSENTGRELPPALLEQLRSLGYVQ